MAAKARKKNPELRQQEEIFGILLMTLALLVLISLITYNPAEEPSGLQLVPVTNAMGVLGVYISYSLIKFFIGYSSIVIPFLLFAWGWNRFRGHGADRLAKTTLYALIVAIYIATVLGLPQATSPEGHQFGFDFSGLVGGFLATMLYKFFGKVGSIILLISIAMITVVAATQFSFERIIAEVFAFVGALSRFVKRQVAMLRNISLPSFSRSSDMEPALSEPASPRVKLPPHLPTKQPKAADDEIPLHKKIRRMSLGDRAPEEDAPPPEPKIPEPPPQPPPQPAPEDAPGPPPAPEQASFLDENITVTERDDLDAPATDDELPDPVALGKYVYPGLDLLDYPEGQETRVSREELLANAKILEERLEEFGVQGKVIEIHPGPVITRYEYEPAPGIKVSRVTSLADDLALSMRAKRIRIVAPIPGKAAIGIELPNREPQIVYLRSIFDDDTFRNSDSPLTMALGKTISGKPFVAQLDKMPHMLVAGSTGAGKSVCLNTIIASILYKAHPTEVQFALIDPKRLELNLYKRLLNHHLVYREDLNEVVVTNPPNALSVLRSLEFEMEQRYDLFAAASVRNIEDFNKRARAGRLKTEDGEQLAPLPYIVVVIDELADLMMTAAKEVEEPIARLTQMARAIGIHLIVATQRPSVDVITGVIKANFPARIAFAVASKTDSRTILDMNGAEKLLGRGDMLFLPPGSPEALRLHGAFIGTDEIERVLDHIHGQPRYPRKLLPVREEEVIGAPDGIGGRGGQRDALFREALKLVVRHQQGSISLLQRRLKVGYARAARLIDELEAAGIVGGFDGSKAREVLVDEEALEHLDLDAI